MSWPGSNPNSASKLSMSVVQIENIAASPPKVEGPSEAGAISPASQRTAPVYGRYVQAIRETLRAPMAEFLGSVIFIVLGVGSTLQTVLSSNRNVAPGPSGTPLSPNIGWAIGLALGVRASVGISGGHINPAITIAMAAWRRFSWKQVPVYLFSQVLGCLVGAALVYGQYSQAIDIFEGGRDVRTRATAAIFAPYPMDYMSAAGSFFSEFLGTSILAFIILASTDERAAAASPSLLPFVIFITLLGLGVSLGMQTAGSFNPARDFGPRLLLKMIGYNDNLYSFQGQYWLWCGILAPILGALVAGGIYELFLGYVSKKDDSQIIRDVERAS